MKRVQQEILLEFDIRIVHIPGKYNKIADKLSREMCFIINANWNEEKTWFPPFSHMKDLNPSLILHL